MLTLIAVERIEPNKLNPNVMAKPEYEALVEDMKVHGARGKYAISERAMAVKVRAGALTFDLEASS